MHRQGKNAEARLDDELHDISLQGPKAVGLLNAHTPVDLEQLKYFHQIETTLFGRKAILSRTGYSGERGYEIFTDQSDVVHLWQSILDEVDPIACTVAEVDGAVAGIANYYPHPDTWEDGAVCYLEDLYVDESHRRTGIGKALIEDLRQRCLENGWLRLHWDTTTDNARARSVYDELTGGTNGFIVYEIETR